MCCVIQKSYVTLIIHKALGLTLHGNKASSLSNSPAGVPYILLKHNKFAHRFFSFGVAHVVKRVKSSKDRGKTGDDPDIPAWQQRQDH